jgi:hypothetical protein
MIDRMIDDSVSKAQYMKILVNTIKDDLTKISAWKLWLNALWLNQTLIILKKLTFSIIFSISSEITDNAWKKR